MRNYGAFTSGKCPDGEERTEVKHIYKIKKEKEASPYQGLQGSSYDQLGEYSCDLLTRKKKELDKEHA